MWREVAFWMALMVGLAGCIVLARSGGTTPDEPQGAPFEAASQHASEHVGITDQLPADGALVAPQFESLEQAPESDAY
jgi:hypothetical protein